MLITAQVSANDFSVQIDGGFPVDRTKVQQYPFITLCIGLCDGPLIPQSLRRVKGVLHPGEGGFNGERDEYFTVKGFGQGRFPVGYSVLPQPVQVLPVVPYHLRTWIVRKYIVWIYLFSPAGLYWYWLHAPAGSNGICFDENGEKQNGKKQVLHGLQK